MESEEQGALGKRPVFPEIDEQPLCVLTQLLKLKGGFGLKSF